MEKKASKSRIAIIMFFMKDQYILESQNLLKNYLQKVYAYDFIPLVFKDFLNVIDAYDPIKALKRLILSKVNLNLISPFIINGPTPDSLFFGREHEMRMITENISTTSYALIGGRRIGKTSILKRLEHVRLPNSGFRVLYHDCSYTPTLVELVQAVTLDKSWFPYPPTITMSSFTDVIQALPADKPLVILLDEADKLIKPDQTKGYPLFNTLRALANARHCQFVFSGEQSLRDELINPKSPFYNFANEMLIGRLDFSAVHELVNQPLKLLDIEVVNEETVIQHIWNFTSGHPNVVQRLCSSLLGRLQEQGIRQITLDDVRTITADPNFQERDFLQTYLEGTSLLERIITLVLSQEARVYRLREVRQLLTEKAYIQPSTTSTKEALDRLVELRSILRRSQNGYEFGVKAFPLVLANTTTIDDLLEVLVEQYNHSEVQV